MARRGEHSAEQLKEMIIQAALDLMIKEGLSALTVRKVALEIGYTIGSVYMVFENMNDLIMHVRFRVIDQLIAHLTEVQSNDGADQRLRDLANAYLEFARQNFNSWQSVFTTINDHPLPEALQQKLEAILQFVEAAYRPLFPQHTDHQIRLATRVLWASLHGLCLVSLNQSLGQEGVENLQASVDELVDRFIRG